MKTGCFDSQYKGERVKCGSIRVLYIIVFMCCGRTFFSLFNTPIVLEILFEVLFECLFQSSLVSKVKPRKLNSFTFTICVLLILRIGKVMCLFGI